MGPKVRSLHFLLRNSYCQAAIVGLVVVLPFLGYVIATHSIIAPLNIVAGWDTSVATHSVVAPIPSDVTQQMIPFRQYIKESLTKHHEIPLWNTKSFAGDVFLANPINAVLSPFNLLLFFIDTYTFQNFIVLFGMFLMSGCMYLLLKQLGLSMPSSALGAFSFSLAPFSIFWSIYGIVALPMAMLPLVLFFYSKWKQRPHRINRYFFLIILVLAFGIYTGHVQIALLPFVVLGLAVGYDLIFSKLGIKKAGYCLLGIGMALLVGSAQLIPLAEQTPLSHRSQEVTVAAPRAWRYRVNELLKIPVAYQLSSGPKDLGLTNRRELTIGQIPGIFFIVAVFVTIGLFMRRQKLGWIGFYLILFALGASWQWNDFPQPLLNSLSPAFRSLATDYFLPIALLAMSVIAAYGMDWTRKVLFKKTSRGHQSYQWVFYSLPILVLIGFAVPQLMLSRVTELNTTYYTCYYLAIILALLFYIIYKQKREAHMLFGAVLVVVTLLQGWALYRVSQPIVTHKIVDTKSQQMNYVAAHSQNQPAVIDYHNPFEAVYYNVSLINGYDSLYSGSILDRIKAINYPAMTPATYRNNALVITNADKTVLFKNLGVQWLLNKKPAVGYIQKAPEVYEADQPTPKAYFARGILNQPRAQQLDTLKSGKVGYHEVAIDGNFSLAGQDSKLSYHQTPNTFTIETNSSTGGLVFIAQTYNKDWRATIDSSTSTNILPAYYDFSAIVVPSGKHVITLRYDQVATKFGFSLSLITTCALVVWWLYLRIRYSDL